MSFQYDDEDSARLQLFSSTFDSRAMENFDINAAIEDPRLREVMIERTVEELYKISQAQISEDRRNPEIALPITVLGRYSGNFDEFINRSGYSTMRNAQPVSMSYAMRYLTFRGMIERFKDEMFPLLISCVNAFDKDFCTILRPTGDENAAYEYDLSTCVARMSNPRVSRNALHDVSEVAADGFPGFVIIDCFKDCSLGDVVDVFTTINKIDFDPSGFAIGFFSIPYSIELMGHIWRYIKSGRRLMAGDREGEIRECGLKYSFEGNYLVFFDGHSVFQYDVDRYRDLVYGTDFELDIDGFRVSIEVYQNKGGILTRRMTVYGEQFYESREQEVRLPAQLMGGYRLVTGYTQIDGGRIVAQPYQVDAKLFDSCLEAAYTMKELTPDNVRLMVAARSQTRTSVLGKTTQTAALGAAKSEALSQAVYLTAFEKMYEATQILKHDSAVRGDNLYDVERKFKRAALTFTGLATMFSIGAVLPHVLVAKILAGTTFTTALTAAMAGSAARLLNLVARGLSALEDWASYADVLLSDDVEMRHVVKQRDLAEKRGKMCLGVGRYDYTKPRRVISYTTSTLFEAGGNTYVRSSYGDYFDATGTRYLMASFPVSQQTEHVVLFSERKQGMHYKLGDLACSEEFQDISLEGYHQRGGNYYKAYHFVTGFTYGRMPPEFADFVFFSINEQKLVYCSIEMGNIADGVDIPFIGLTAINGWEGTRYQLMQRSMTLKRVNELMHLNNPLIRKYDPRGIVLGKNLKYPDLNASEGNLEDGNFIYSPLLRYSNAVDVQFDRDLYKTQITQLAQYIMNHRKFSREGIVLEEYMRIGATFTLALDQWYSRYSAPPFEGIKLEYHIPSRRIVYNFSDVDFSDVVPNNNIVDSFNYLYDEEDDPGEYGEP